MGVGSEPRAAFMHHGLELMLGVRCTRQFLGTKFGHDLPEVGWSTVTLPFIEKMLLHAWPRLVLLLAC